jgi:DNA end-binding protein Ku
VQPDLLKLAEHILKSKEATFDPSQFVDRYEQAVLEVLKNKQEGMPAKRLVAMAPARNVVNLFDALRASIAHEKTAAPKPVAKSGKKAAKRNPDQREMLLPITGSGKGKEAAKEAPKEPAKKPAASSTRRKAG